MKSFLRISLWVLVIGFLAGTGLAVLTHVTYFNSRSGLRWSDTTEAPAETVTSITLALCLPGKDPRIDDESCIQKLLTIPAGQDLILKPLLEGLPAGTYLVYPRGDFTNGALGFSGPWSDPFPVYVDIVPPVPPAQVETK